MAKKNEQGVTEMNGSVKLFPEDFTTPSVTSAWIGRQSANPKPSASSMAARRDPPAARRCNPRDSGRRRTCADWGRRSTGGPVGFRQQGPGGPRRAACRLVRMRANVGVQLWAALV